MIMMGAEADKSTLPLVPYEPVIVKRYRVLNRARARYRLPPTIPRSSGSGEAPSEPWLPAWDHWSSSSIYSPSPDRGRGDRPHANTLPSLRRSERSENLIELRAHRQV